MIFFREYSTVDLFCGHYYRERSGSAGNFTAEYTGVHVNEVHPYYIFWHHQRVLIIWCMLITLFQIHFLHLFVYLLIYLFVWSFTLHTRIILFILHMILNLARRTSYYLINQFHVSCCRLTWINTLSPDSYEFKFLYRMLTSIPFYRFLDPRDEVGDPCESVRVPRSSTADYSPGSQSRNVIASPPPAD